MAATVGMAALAAFLGYFDRRTSYEASVMTVVSIGLGFLLAPLYENVRREALPHRPAAVWTVLLLCSTVLVLQVVSIIAWRENDLFATHMSFTASLFSLVGTLGVIYVFNSSYAFEFPPVAFPSIFLAATVPHELAIAQHCLKSGASVITALQLTIVAMKSATASFGFISRNRFSPARAAASTHQYFLPWSSFTSISGLRSNFTIEDLPGLSWKEDPKLLYQRFCVHFDEGMCYNKGVRISCLLTGCKQ